MPATAQAWAAGEIGADHVDLLAGAAGGGRARVVRPRREPCWSPSASELTFGQVVKAVRYWCQRADAELDRDGPPPPKPATLRLHTGFDGTVTGDFSLDPIGGATVTEALRRIERDLYRQDQRDGVIRTTELNGWPPPWSRWPCAPHTVPAGGRRPEPLICILAGEATVEQLCELATGTVISPRTWSCPTSPGPRCRRSSSTAPTGSSPPPSSAPSGACCAAPSKCATGTANTPPAATPRSPTATSTTASPTPTAGSPPKPTGTWNANPTTANPTSTAANPPTPSKPPANADNSTTSPANDSAALTTDQANRPPPHAA